MSEFYNNAIFWVDVEKVHPNPFQPRKEFDEAKLRDLSESIKMYGILQPLVVTRREMATEDGGLTTLYELISGERRLRASKLAGLVQVPVLIRSSEDTDREKLELAIIENLQREDLNAVDRARAFDRLVKEFHFKHIDVARKMGKSREYVSNTLRILALPGEILDALSQGRISEGHTRPILMLMDRPEEQMTLYKEIIFKKLTVREAEAIARKIAFDRIRRKDYGYDPELVEIEEKLKDALGTRVSIERRDVGGKVMIDFFSNDDLRTILDTLEKHKAASPNEALNRHIASLEQREGGVPAQSPSLGGGSENSTPSSGSETSAINAVAPEEPIEETPVDDRSKEDIKKDEEEEDLYSIKNFSI